MRLRYLEPGEIPQAPGIPVYGTRAWLEAVAAHTVWPLKIVALEEQGQIVAWHPFLQVHRGPWKRALPLFIDTTGGPYYLIPENLAFAERSRWLREKQENLLKHLASEVDFATLCPLESDPRALPHNGSWKTLIRATARLDLESASPPWSAQALRKLRKAGNKGLSLTQTENPLRLVEALESVHTRHQLGNSALATPVFLGLWRELHQRGLLETWTVLDSEKQEIAYGTVVPDQATDTVRFWYNLNTAQGLKLYASDFLFHGLAEAYRGRFRWLDLCGTDNANLIGFKEKWASESVYSFAYDYARKPWMRLALSAFGKLRRKTHSA